MAYVITENRLGQTHIGSSTLDTSAAVPLGTIVKAVDPTYGEGEFIYLKGVAATVVGSAVIWRALTYQTILAPVGGALPEGIAFAMAATVAANYGWYQIGGMAVAKKAVAISLAANAAVAIDTTGLVSETSSGDELLGALVVAVASAKSDVSTVTLSINRPVYQGRIT